jgi:hypothetical protein
MEQKKVQLPSGAIASINLELTAGQNDDWNLLVKGTKKEDVIDDNGQKVIDETTGKPKTTILDDEIIKLKYALIQMLVTRIDPKDGKSNEKVTEELLRGMSIADVKMLQDEALEIIKRPSIKPEDEKK